MKDTQRLIRTVRTALLRAREEETAVLFTIGPSVEAGESTTSPDRYVYTTDSHPVGTGHDALERLLELAELGLSVEVLQEHGYLEVG